MSARAMARLRDLGEWTGGNTPSKVNAAYWTNGTVPWVSPKDMKVYEITTSEDRVSAAALTEGRVSLVPAGSVLVVTRSGILSHTLPVAVTKLPVTINQDLKALLPKPGISPTYVAHALRGATRRILDQCSKHGTTVASIETKALLDFEIPMVNIDEQNRIVAEIEKQFSRLDEAVANLKRVNANLKRYKAAVLKAAVEGRLVTTEAQVAHRDGRDLENGAQLLQRIRDHKRRLWTGRTKYVEPENLDASTLPALPEGWAWVPLGDLGVDPFNTVQTGPFGAQLHNTEFTDAGVPVIAVGNLTGTGFTSEGVYFITDAKAKQLARYDVWAGDLLFARSGATLGKVCIAPAEVQGWRMTGHILRARLNPEFVIPEIVMYSLAALPSVRRQVYGNVRGVTRPGFNTSLLNGIAVPVPPLKEQGRIVCEAERLMSVLSSVGRDVDGNLRQAEIVRQLVLRMAFTATPSEAPL